MRVLDHLLKLIRDAAVFNPEAQVAPACILWSDRERQWEAVIPILQAGMPELLVLGDYAPEKRTGPAIEVSPRIELMNPITPYGPSAMVARPSWSGYTTIRRRFVGFVANAGARNSGYLFNLIWFRSFFLRACYVKDVASAPWYHVFDGDRINDHHPSLKEKRAAREVAE
ncbi:MAG: hypothetical protein PHC51_03725 [bacterium]|nr:hypothetical protein [bacterium]